MQIVPKNLHMNYQLTMNTLQSLTKVQQTHTGIFDIAKYLSATILYLPDIFVADDHCFL